MHQRLEEEVVLDGSGPVLRKLWYPGDVLTDFEPIYVAARVAFVSEALVSPALGHGGQLIVPLERRQGDGRWQAPRGVLPRLHGRPQPVVGSQDDRLLCVSDAPRHDVDATGGGNEFGENTHIVVEIVGAAHVTPSAARPGSFQQQTQRYWHPPLGRNGR